MNITRKELERITRLVATEYHAVMVSTDGDTDRAGLARDRKLEALLPQLVTT